MARVRKKTQACLWIQVALVLCAGWLAAPSWAVNKCTETDGKVVYQDTACSANSADAEQIKIFKSAPQSPIIRREAIALCEQGIRAKGAWKDPDSLKIDDVVRIGFTTITLHNAPTMVVKYGAFVNGKNSYGAYVGRKPALCYFDQTETRLLSVETF